MTPPTVLSLLVLFIGVPLNLYVTVYLWRLSRSAPRVRVLRLSAVSSTVVLIVVAVYGLLFVNNDFVPPPLAFEDTKLVTRFAMLVLAIIPAAYWLNLYRRSGQ